MKKQKQVRRSIDSVEALKSLPEELRRSLSQEGKKAIFDAWQEILNPNPKSEQRKVSGDLRPGEELNFKEEKQTVHVEAGIDYAGEIIHAEKRAEAQTEHETKTRIQEILIEIKQLTKSSKELSVQFKDVAKVEAVPEKAGKYDINFIEWVLAMIRSAQKRVETAVSWTQALHSKRNQKQYWSLFKKHGTSFGLSGERVVATQVG